MPTRREISPAAGRSPAEMDAEAYQRLATPQRTKYGNRKTTVDGIEFDSMAEARRYRDLMVLRDAGEISNFERQPRYPLVVNGFMVGEYRADFRYFDNESRRMIVEDVKGVRTPVYQLKRKLVKAIHNIDITEVQ